jgi:hypothetical protein
MHKKLLVLTFLFLVSTLIPIVFAQGSGVNINDLPNQISGKLGVDIFTAQLIASAALVVMVTVLIGFAVRGRGSTLPIIAVCDFLALGICVSLTWLPIWTFTICIFMVALLAGLRMKDLI